MAESVGGASSGQGDAVRVAVRVRPLLPRELEAGDQCIMDMTENSTTITDPTAFLSADADQRNTNMDLWKTSFNFDRCFNSCEQIQNEQDEDEEQADGIERKVFSELATQKDVFDTYGPWVVDNIMQGYNCCVFAYGQTGSGKTYSMLGNTTSEEHMGLTPRICRQLFKQMATSPPSAQDPNQPGAVYKNMIEASYYEIYNERVFDLLAQDPNKQTSLRVREHPTAGSYVEDLLSITVDSYGKVIKLLAEGSKARRIAHTKMNSLSSRSHAVFQLLFRQSQVRGNRKTTKTSKLFLVDLAGSERVASSGAEGMRLKEAVNINKSLSALADVIKALSSSDRSVGGAGAFVPYRNSVLTWLLKESLGGNSKTVMIAAVSPHADSYTESLSTLKYAERAKKIVNKARVNQDTAEEVISSLRAEIEALKTKLQSQVNDDFQDGTISEGNSNRSGEDKEQAAEYEAQMHKLQEKISEDEKLMDQLSQTWAEKEMKSEEHFNRVEAEKMRLQEEREQFEVEVDRLRREQHEQQQREEDDERKRSERHQRHCVELEQEVQKRKAEYHKQQTLKQHLSKANLKIASLETELVGTKKQRDELERNVRDQKQRNEQQKMRTERATAKEKKAVGKQHAEKVQEFITKLATANETAAHAIKEKELANKKVLKLKEELNTQVLTGKSLAERAIKVTDVAKTQVETANVKTEAALKEVELANEQIASANSKAEQALQELEKVKAQTTTANEQIENKLELAQRELITLRQKFEAQVEISEEKIQHATADTEEAKKEIEMLKQDRQLGFQKQEDEMNQLRGTNGALERELESVQGMCTQFITTIHPSINGQQEIPHSESECDGSINTDDCERKEDPVSNQNDIDDKGVLDTFSPPLVPGISNLTVNSKMSSLDLNSSHVGIGKVAIEVGTMLNQVLDQSRQVLQREVNHELVGLRKREKYAQEELDRVRLELLNLRKEHAKVKHVFCERGKETKQHVDQLNETLRNEQSEVREAQARVLQLERAGADVEAVTLREKQTRTDLELVRSALTNSKTEQQRLNVLLKESRNSSEKIEKQLKESLLTLNTEREANAKAEASQVGGLKKDLAVLSERKSNIQKELAATTSDLEQRNKECADLRHSVTQLQEQLAEQAEKVRSAVDASSARERQIGLELKCCRSELERSEEDQARLTEQVSETKVASQIVSDQLQEVLAALEREKESNNVDSHFQEDDLKRQLAVMGERENHMTKRVDLLTTELERSEEHTLTLTVRLKEYKSEALVHTRDLTSALEDERRKRIELEADVQNEQEACKTALTDVEQLQVELAHARKQIERVCESETIACVQAAKLKEEVRFAEENNQKLQCSVLEATERVAELEQEIENEKKRNTEHEFEFEARMSKGLRGLEQWTREKQDLEHMLVAETRNKTDLQEQLDTSSQELTHVQMLLNASRQRETDMRDIVEAKEEEIRSCTLGFSDKTNRLEVDVNRLSNELNAELSRVTRLDIAKGAAEDQVARLELVISEKDGDITRMKGTLRQSSEALIEQQQTNQGLGEALAKVRESFKASFMIRENELVNAHEELKAVVAEEQDRSVGFQIKITELEKERQHERAAFDRILEAQEQMQGAKYNTFG